MKALIIYAHPGSQGHCSETLLQVEQSLKSKSIEFRTIDLYKIRYNPVLCKEEIYTAGKPKLSKSTLKFQKMIKGADRLVFIYPLWWGTPPAILKGFFGVGDTVAGGYGAPSNENEPEWSPALALRRKKKVSHRGKLTRRFDSVQGAVLALCGGRLHPLAACRIANGSFSQLTAALFARPSLEACPESTPLRGSQYGMVCAGR